MPKSCARRRLHGMNRVAGFSNRVENAKTRLAASLSVLQPRTTPHHKEDAACVTAVSEHCRNGWIRPCPRPEHPNRPPSSQDCGRCMYGAWRRGVRRPARRRRLDSFRVNGAVRTILPFARLPGDFQLYHDFGSVVLVLTRRPGIQDPRAVYSACSAH